jgi:hypothetical protein
MVKCARSSAGAKGIRESNDLNRRVPFRIFFLFEHSLIVSSFEIRASDFSLFVGRPVGPNRSRLEGLLSEAAKAQTEIVTLEDDNRLAMLAKTGVRTEYATLNRFDPAYFQTLTVFLNRML